MMDRTDQFLPLQPVTAMRPLLGTTVLLVEDSRYACEAMRLLCLRSGARIRRADSLYHAGQHLKVYRPGVVIIDIGLPDGSGLDLISSLVQGTPRIDVVLGTSGDTENEAAALNAGADGFIPKPISSLSAFQSQILRHLPAERQPPGPRLINDEKVSPDMIAFHDDLSHVAQVLEGAEATEAVDYLTQFLGGVARSVDDRDLNAAVIALAERRKKGEPLRPGITQLSALVQTRLAAAGPI